jgi:phytoene synthase
MTQSAAAICPMEWLADLDIPPGQQLRPEYRDRMAVLARRLAELVERYEESARIGAARLPFRSRWAVLAAAGIYGDIAREVTRLGPRAWDKRVGRQPAGEVALGGAKLGGCAPLGGANRLR